MNTSVLHHTLPSLTLESGEVLQQVDLAYQTWGRLNSTRDNTVMVCHSLTSDTDANVWWNNLIGPGRALDTNQYFIICINVLGSSYGSAGPLSLNPKSGRRYGPDFPLISIRDIVQAQQALLDHLAIQKLDIVIGGSLGGMLALEWAFWDKGVNKLIPIATSGRHSAWCIGWSEAQRQAIYADPNWKNGYYDESAPPEKGMSNARMIAMLSYRSQPSFEDRFGREKMNGSTQYVVESYLKHQGIKLVRRFDANAYVRLTQAMDTHDISRGRGEYHNVLQSIKQPTLVVGINSDILYPVREQLELVEHIPHAEFGVIKSPHGHDAFLIEQEQLNALISDWLNKQ